MVMNLTGFRPMKSATPPQDFDFSTLHWPMWASPKIDGIRCVIHPELGPVTNTLKAIPNEFIRHHLSVQAQLCYCDGELVVGDPDDPRSFNQTQSGVMSFDGTPNFTFLVFDNFQMGHTCGFGIRKEDARAAVEKYQAAVNVHPYAKILHQTLIENYEQLAQYEAEQLALGYEGVMLRSPQGLYKFGRSTLKQEGMIKIKRFVDAEAIIIGWEPLERNLNDPTIDALGLQKRGYSKEGKVIDDSRVGRFCLRGLNGQFAGVEFWCGSGLDDADRLQFRKALREYAIDSWPIRYDAAIRDGLFNSPSNPMGKIMTYKYQQHGSIDAPRTPIWKGIRYDS